MSPFALRIAGSGLKSTLLFGMVLIGVCISSIRPATADTWFVDNVAGQDSNDGRSPAPGPMAAGPFRTINQALKASNQGDRIVLAKNETPYREMLTFAGRRNSGFNGVPFRLIGNGAILSGTQEILPQQWRYIQPDVFACRPADGSFQQLYLGPKPATYQALQRHELDQLEPLAWTLIDGQIYFRTTDKLLPGAFDLHYAGLQTGVTLYLTENVSVENLIIQGFWQDGVNAHDNVKAVQLVGVTVRGNGRSGVSVGGASRLDVVSSLIGDNWQHQVRTESQGHLRLLGSNVLPGGHGKVMFKDGGVIEEEVPVVNTPIRQRLPLASPFRQAAGFRVPTPAGQSDPATR